MNEGMYLNTIKAMSDKPTAIILNGEKLFFDIGNKTRMSTFFNSTWYWKS
jgi:hypothetical protein